MSAKLPGDRICRVLARWVDTTTLHEVIEPTIADLQHEVQSAPGRRWHRHAILLRGYAALVRALVVCSVRSGSAVPHGAALLFLSFGGAALMMWARSTRSDAKVLNSAFLLPMFVTPLVLRAMGAGASYWQLFAGGVTVGLVIMLADGFVLTDNAAPLLFRAVQFSIACLPVMLISAAAATAAWQPTTGRQPFVRQFVRAVLASGLTAALAFGPIVAWPHGTSPMVVAAMVPFYVCLFGILFAVTLAPLILILRGWTGARSHLALAGALLSPMTICSSSYLDGGTVRQCLEMLRSAPGAFLVSGFPFMLGATVLGWSLRARAVNSRGQVEVPPI